MRNDRNVVQHTHRAAEDEVRVRLIKQGCGSSMDLRVAVGRNQVVQIQAEGRVPVGAGPTATGELLVLEMAVLRYGIQKQIEPPGRQVRGSVAPGLWLRATPPPHVT